MRQKYCDIAGGGSCRGIWRLVVVSDIVTVMNAWCGLRRNHDNSSSSSSRAAAVWLYSINAGKVYSSMPWPSTLPPHSTGCHAADSISISRIFAIRCLAKRVPDYFVPSAITWQNYKQFWQCFLRTRHKYRLLAFKFKCNLSNFLTLLTSLVAFDVFWKDMRNM